MRLKSRRVRVLLAAAIAASVMSLPLSARASGGWTWPLGGSATLRYGETYVGPSGASRTHGGLDIAGAAGAEVAACAAGEVAFSGLVPGTDGGRVWAVTVAVPDGLRVTYLPLSRSSVAKGGEVSAGTVLGRLADSGDASSAATHLHLGVKRGSTPLDPLTFLAQRGSPPVTTGASGGAATPTRRAPVAPRSLSYASAPSAPAPSAAAHGAQAAVPRVVSSAVPALRAGSVRFERIEQVASPAVLDLDKARADLTRWRGTVVGIIVQLVALALAIGCAVAVMRAARTAGAAAANEPAAARSRRAQG